MKESFKPSVKACMNRHCKFLQGLTYETTAGTKRRLICTFGSGSFIPGNLFECPMKKTPDGENDR